MHFYLAYPVHVYCVCLGEASGAVSGKFPSNDSREPKSSAVLILDIAGGRPV